MKKILLLALVVSFSLCGYAQIDTIHYNQLGVTGKVKSIQEYTFAARDSIGYIVKSGMVKATHEGDEDGLFFVDNDERQTNFKYEYSSLGHMLKSTIFYGTNQPYKTTDFTYDHNNCIISATTNMFYSDMTLNLKDIYKYNASNLLITESRYRNGDFLERADYKYDKSKLTSKTQVRSDGSINRKTDFVYANDKLVEEVNYDNNDEFLNSTYIYEYDHFGNNTKFIIKWKDGSSMITEYYYDNNGRLIKIFENNKTYTTQSYNDDGDIIEIINYRKESNIASKTRYIYNNGILQTKIVDTENEKNTIEYDRYGLVSQHCTLKNEEINDCYNYDITYDQKGNWTKIIETKNSVPLKIRERVIVYY